MYITKKEMTLEEFKKAFEGVNDFCEESLQVIYDFEMQYEENEEEDLNVESIRKAWSEYNNYDAVINDFGKKWLSYLENNGCVFQISDNCWLVQNLT